MSKTSEEKEHAAVERVCEAFEELDLTMKESIIVAYSVYTALKGFEEMEQTQAEEDSTSKIIRWLPSICGCLAIIISLISIFASISK